MHKSTHPLLSFPLSTMSAEDLFRASRNSRKASFRTDTKTPVGGRRVLQRWQTDCTWTVECRRWCERSKRQWLHTAHLCGFPGRLDVVVILLDAGGNPHHKDESGNTSGDYAKQANHQLMVDHLTKPCNASWPYVPDIWVSAKKSKCEATIGTTQMFTHARKDLRWQAGTIRPVSAGKHTYGIEIWVFAEWKSQAVALPQDICHRVAEYKIQSYNRYEFFPNSNFVWMYKSYDSTSYTCLVQHYVVAYKWRQLYTLRYVAFSERFLFLSRSVLRLPWRTEAFREDDEVFGSDYLDKREHFILDGLVHQVADAEQVQLGVEHGSNRGEAVKEVLSMSWNRRCVG